MPISLELRDVADTDLPIFFAHHAEPEAINMAVFAPRSHDQFQDHWAKIRADPTTITQTSLDHGTVAGYVGSVLRLGQREVCYWIGREFWHRGVATGALQLLLKQISERPLHARVAKSNRPSLRVLEKCGFKIVGEERCALDGVEEIVLSTD